MKSKIRYQSKADLKCLRQLYKFSKEDVADKIGYTVRSLERMERQNSVTQELTAYQLCDLYHLDFHKQFYIINQEQEDFIKEALSNDGQIPNGKVNPNNEYYYLYVRKQGIFEDCIAGKGMWIADYNRNKEIRRLQKVDAKKVLKYEPDIMIINNAKEWDYWYFKLCIGKMYKAMVSEICMKERLRTCLKDVIINRKDLLIYEGISDIMFWGRKK